MQMHAGISTLICEMWWNNQNYFTVAQQCLYDIKIAGVLENYTQKTTYKMVKLRGTLTK